jgi:hypothetical protein
MEFKSGKWGDGRFAPSPSPPRPLAGSSDSKTQVVVAAEQQGSFHFKDTEDTECKVYEWLGELRTEHSLRLSNDFAAILSRVALDESEWLRLWATKG